MKKNIKDIDIKNKKVIIRVDFNVPIKEGVITDDNRIKESLPTINYALNEGAKVILLSHLGRVEKEEDMEKNTLEPVAYRLSELLDKDITFVDMTRGEELEAEINNMNSGELILVENTRFEDIDGKKESKNNEELGQYWASLADVFINDAFGTAHRAHASNVGIASHLENGVGFLIEQELEMLDKAIKEPKKPFVEIGRASVRERVVQCVSYIVAVRCLQ